MTSPVPVSDASRKAAAEYIRYHDYLVSQDIRNGRLDTHAAAQAFERARLAALDEAAELIRECEQTFRFYEQSHLAKKTQEGDEKAYRNKVMADKCTAFLALKETPDAK